MAALLAQIEDDLDIAALEVKKPIGSGNFAEVFAGVYKGRNCAVKKQKLMDEFHAKYIVSEISILKETNPPNLLAYIASCYKEAEEIVYIVTELLSGGDLREYVLNESSNGNFPSKSPGWNFRTTVIKELASGLEYLHGNGLMHRDVKTDNVILKPGVPPTAVWCDFGFARKLERTRSAQELNRMTICGTDEFMSPELMFDMEYSFSSDIFSFGVLIAEVVSGKEPSNEASHLVRSPCDGFTFAEEELRASMPMNAPFSLVELCVQCCADEPDDRPIAQDIFEWTEELEAELDNAESPTPTTTPEKSDSRKEESVETGSDQNDDAGNCASLKPVQKALSKAALLKKKVTRRRSSLINMSFETRDFELELDNLQLQECISSRGKTAIYTGKYNSGTLAIKTVTLEKHQVADSGYISKELSVLRDIVHPNLLKYVGAKFAPTESKIYVAMELLGGQTLRQFLESDKNLAISNTGLSCHGLHSHFLSELSNAVLYLHDRYILHRNIRTENCMLSLGKRLVLCDLGLAKYDPNTTLEGEPFNPFSSPEMLSIQATDENDAGQIMYDSYSFSSDIYSAGLVMLEIITGKAVTCSFPEREEGSHSMLASSLLEVIPKQTPEVVVDMLLSACEKNVSDRATADVLHDAALANLRMNNIMQHRKDGVAERITSTRKLSTHPSNRRSLPRSPSKQRARKGTKFENPAKYNFEGYLWKKGQWNPRWRKRLFCLANLQFEYFRPLGKTDKDNERGAPLGTIRLNDIKLINGKIANIVRGKSKGTNDSAFKICTVSRTYWLRAGNSDERAKWLNYLNSENMVARLSTLTIK